MVGRMPLELIKFFSGILGIAIAVDSFLIGRAIFLLHSTRVGHYTATFPSLQRLVLHVSEIVMFQLCFLRAVMEVCSEMLELKFRLTDEEKLIPENEPVQTSCELPNVRHQICSGSQATTVTEGSDSLHEGNGQLPDDVDVTRIVGAVSTGVERLSVGLLETETTDDTPFRSLPSSVDCSEHSDPCSVRSVGTEFCDCADDFCDLIS
ncbi:hypothetical protein M513_06252 [Trichuris suis]|uniref:Uncharacterized protein n=1 Tax=Trichuris suis TaxID=68888 RepID=A0A085M6U6_9BILA|nr:hypothetical protein M513_06252 [Trichuris suis]